jgi:integrase
MDRKNSMARRPRGTGCLYRQPGSEIWWVQFHRNGQRFRESTGTDNKRKAQDYLQDKIAEASLGTYSPLASQATVAELIEAKLTSDKNNGRKDLRTAEGRWKLHLQPFLGHAKARDLSTAILNKYVERRQSEGAPNATINRELSLVRAAFHAARRSGILRVIPYFPMLTESNVRKGFLRDDQYTALATACAAEGLWLRAAFEVAHAYGWRRGELLSLRVRQLDFPARTIRLFDTKNGSGRVVVMTEKVQELLSACCVGKGPDDFVFTRKGQPVVDMSKAWKRVTDAAGCPGLLFHDLRRTGVRNLRRLGVSETIAMKISGHKTSAMFRRYDIDDESDLREVARKLDEKQKSNFGHSLAIVQPKDELQEDKPKVKVVLVQ